MKKTVYVSGFWKLKRPQKQIISLQSNGYSIVYPKRGESSTQIQRAKEMQKYDCVVFLEGWGKIEDCQQDFRTAIVTGKSIISKINYL